MSYENLVLLCPNHHAFVDELEPERFTVSVLEEMKRQADLRAESHHYWADETLLDKAAHDLVVHMELLWVLTEQAEDAATRERIASAIGTLSDREKIVLSLYYFEGLTTGEIAQVLDVSHQRVSQIHRGALRNMRRTADLPGSWRPARDREL